VRTIQVRPRIAREVKWILTDPGVRGLSGHHPASLSLLSSALRADELLVLGHRDPDPALVTWLSERHLNVRPHFTSYLYDGYRRDWTHAEASPFIAALASEYSDAFRVATEESAGDLLVFLHHTADWPALAAIAQAIERSDDRAARHVVFLMFPPGIDWRGEISDIRRANGYRLALLSLRRLGSQVRLYTGSAELSEAYRRGFAMDDVLGLHPVFFFDADSYRSSGASLPSDLSPLTLYLGDAKPAKGFMALPKLVEALLPITTFPLRIQFGLDSRLGSPEVLAVVDALRRLRDEYPRLELIEDYVDDEAMPRLLRDSRFVLFSYNSVAYADQTSGLLWQAAAADIPVVVIGESWLSRETQRICSRRRLFKNYAAFIEALRAGPLEFAEEEVDHGYRATLFEPLPRFLARQMQHWADRSPPFRGYEVFSGLPRPPESAKSVLFVDLALPDPGSSAGSHAALQELALFRAAGYRPTVYAIQTRPGDLIGTAALERAGCTVGIAEQGMARVLASLRDFDVIYVTRFNAAEVVIDKLRSRFPSARFLLNLADCHGLRYSRAAELGVEGVDERQAGAIRARELAVAIRFDVVLAYTEVERDHLRRELVPRVPVDILPWVDEIGPGETVPGFSDRRDIAFLGGFRHHPNLDGIRWFIGNVMPAIRDRLPGVRLRVFGAGIPASLRTLEAEDVLIEGFVDSVADALSSVRVFVAPLRYGAGIKGKVIAALCHGVPVVASSIAAEGIETDASECFLRVVDSPEDWVREIARLYESEDLWNRSSLAAKDHAAATYSFSQARVIFDALLERALIQS
jgi:glycosyltransferase involved in cell wall biosynthesis